MNLSFLIHFPCILAFVDRHMCDFLDEQHNMYGALLYIYIHITQITGEFVNPPRIIILPHWYLNLICVKQNPAMQGKLLGLHIYDVSEKRSQVFISRKVDLKTLYGMSILFHECVHAIQYVNGSPNRTYTELETEARQLQAEFLRKHKYPEEVIAELILPVPPDLMPEVMR